MKIRRTIGPRTIGDELPAQIERVTELLIEYEKIGPNGMFAANGCRVALASATKAMAEGDLVAMLQAYKELEAME